MLNCNWIDGNLLLSILKADHESRANQIKIVDFNVEAATKKGDNYASEMYRAVIEFEKDGKFKMCRRILKVSLLV